MTSMLEKYLALPMLDFAIVSLGLMTPIHMGWTVYRRAKDGVWDRRRPHLKPHTAVQGLLAGWSMIGSLTLEILTGSAFFNWLKYVSILVFIHFAVVVHSSRPQTQQGDR